MPLLQGEAPDQARQAPLQHFDDAAFAAAAAVDAGDAGHYPVAVHDLAHFIGRKEQVVAIARFGPQEAEAVGVGDHHARDQVHLLGRGETATPVLQQLAVANHRAQALAQCIETFRRGQVEAGGKVFGGLWAFGSGQLGQDRFAAGDGVGITLGLARGMRVPEAGARWRWLAVGLTVGL